MPLFSTSQGNVPYYAGYQASALQPFEPRALSTIAQLEMSNAENKLKQAYSYRTRDGKVVAGTPADNRDYQMMDNLYRNAIDETLKGMEKEAKTQGSWNAYAKTDHYANSVNELNKYEQLSEQLYNTYAPLQDENLKQISTTSEAITKAQTQDRPALTMQNGTFVPMGVSKSGFITNDEVLANAPMISNYRGGSYNKVELPSTIQSKDAFNKWSFDIMNATKGQSTGYVSNAGQSIAGMVEQRSGSNNYSQVANAVQYIKDDFANNPEVYADATQQFLGYASKYKLKETDGTSAGYTKEQVSAVDKLRRGLKLNAEETAAFSGAVASWAAAKIFRFEDMFKASTASSYITKDPKFSASAENDPLKGMTFDAFIQTKDFFEGAAEPTVRQEYSSGINLLPEVVEYRNLVNAELAKVKKEATAEGGKYYDMVLEEYTGIPTKYENGTNINFTKQLEKVKEKKQGRWADPMYGIDDFEFAEIALGLRNKPEALKNVGIEYVQLRRKNELETQYGKLEPKRQKLEKLQNLSNGLAPMKPDGGVNIKGITIKQQNVPEERAAAYNNKLKSSAENGTNVFVSQAYPEGMIFEETGDVVDFQSIFGQTGDSPIIIGMEPRVQRRPKMVLNAQGKMTTMPVVMRDANGKAIVDEKGIATDDESYMVYNVAFTEDQLERLVENNKTISQREDGKWVKAQHGGVFGWEGVISESMVTDEGKYFINGEEKSGLIVLRFVAPIRASRGLPSFENYDQPKRETKEIQER